MMRGLARSNDFGGFTLVEMLVVVVIISVIVGFSVPAYQSFTRSVNLRNDKVAFASYLRASQRASLAHRKDVCIEYVEASAAQATNDKVEARYITGSCNAANFAAGEAISGLGVMSASKTVDFLVNGNATYGEIEYSLLSYTMTGGTFSYHLCDDLSTTKYGLAASRSEFTTFIIQSGSGLLTVFPCGRNPAAAAWGTGPCP